MKSLPTWPARRAQLAQWYAGARRDLPWRRTTDPYAIVVSELMLQQTQVVTVIPYYERWLAQFPTWAALARAPKRTVLKAWEGLGYYTRARNLHALAKAVTKAGGELPRTEEGLRALPGFGPYTAAAVGSIAFGLPLAVLDGNVMRVLTRLLAMPDDISRPQTRARLQQVADQFLDWNRPSEHNQAVMELGATVCLPRKPLCLLCPLQESCEGRDRAEEFPVKSRAPQLKRTETVAVLCHGDRLYCEQVQGKPWHGLWRFPDFDPQRMDRGEVLATVRYGITRYSVTMEAVAATWKGRAPVSATVRYLAAEEIGAYAFAAPHRRLARLLMQS